MIKKKQITEANSKTGAKIDSKTGDKTDLNGGKKDLNNLFLRLIIQQERQPGLIGGEQWAEILKILIDREVAAGGPYYNENDVVDLGLNIRIAFLLKTQKVALSKLLKFIQTSKSKLNEIDTQIKFKLFKKTSKPIKLGASKKIGIIENGSLTKNAKTKILATPILKINKKIYQIILQGLCRELSAWPPALAAAGLGELKALAKSDYDYQIGLLPLFFGQAQNLEIDSKIRPLIIKLGQANFYLWLAYKIYDNLLDNEGENILLPIANLAFKNFLTIYQNLSLGVKWDKFFSRLLVDLENYNYQELKNSQNYLKNSILMRPPRGATRHGAEFRNLHEKSLAHALGPLAILIYQGHRPNDKEFKKILNFFRGYLNARQLDDDLHDWPNDLGRGRINSVGYYILKSGQQKKFNLKTDLKILKKIFFKQALGPISQKLIKLINSAESALHGSNLIKQPEYLKQFLEPLKASVKKAESEHKELNLLLRDYKKLCS